MNIHSANTETLESLFENGRSARAIDSTSSFFGIAGFTLGKPKHQPPPNAKLIHPMVQLKLNIVQKNPTVFLRLRERLRERKVLFSNERQVLEIHNFLNELTMVDVREEIKANILDTADARAPWFFRSSARRDVKKKRRTSEFTNENSAQAVSEGDSKSNSDGSPALESSSSSRSRSRSPPRLPLRLPSRLKSPNLLRESSKSRDQQNSPKALLLPPVENQMNWSRKRSTSFDVEDYVGPCPERR